MFKKTQDKINKLIEDKLKEIYDKEPPVDNGNYYQLKQEMEAKNQELNAFLEYENNTNQRNILNNYDALNSNKWFFNYWFYLNYQANYFANIFQWDSDKNKLDILKILRFGFLFGRAGLYKVNDKTFIPVIINEVIKNHIGETTKISFSKITLFDDYLGGDYNDINNKASDKNNVMTLYNEETKNIKIYQYNSLGIPAVVLFQPNFKLFEDFFYIFDGISDNYKNNTIYNMGVNENPQEALENIKNYKDKKRSVILNFNANSVRKIWEVIDLPKTGSECVDFFNKLKNIHYELMGRRSNLNQKQERNVSSEVDITNDVYEILEQDIRIHLEEFFKDLKEFKINVYIINKEEQEKEGEQNEYNNSRDKEIIKRDNSKS